MLEEMIYPAACHDTLIRLFENLNTGGEVFLRRALRRPGERRDHAGMPTSRRQRVYDHRLAALLFATTF